MNDVEKIEREYDARCGHARSMYHMAVQAAEAELRVALGVAYEIREAALAGADDKPTLEDVAMAAQEPYAVNRLSEIQP